MPKLMDQLKSFDGATEQREGPLARTIEKQTSKLPSDTFLWAAIGAIGLSWVFELTTKKKEANFIATWVPTLLTLGVYNKLVKLHGSDSESSLLKR